MCLLGLKGWQRGKQAQMTLHAPFGPFMSFFIYFLLLSLILMTLFRYFTSFETMYGVLGAGDEENGPK